MLFQTLSIKLRVLCPFCDNYCQKFQPLPLDVSNTEMLVRFSLNHRTAELQQYSTLLFLFIGLCNSEVGFC